MAKTQAQKSVAPNKGAHGKSLPVVMGNSSRGGEGGAAGRLRKKQAQKLRVEAAKVQHQAAALAQEAKFLEEWNSFPAFTNFAGTYRLGDGDQKAIVTLTEQDDGKKIVKVVDSNCHGLTPELHINLSLVERYDVGVFTPNHNLPLWMQAEQKLLHALLRNALPKLPLQFVTQPSPKKVAVQDTGTITGLSKWEEMYRLGTCRGSIVSVVTAKQLPAVLLDEAGKAAIVTVEVVQSSAEPVMAVVFKWAEAGHELHGLKEGSFIKIRYLKLEALGTPWGTEEQKAKMADAQKLHVFVRKCAMWAGIKAKPAKPARQERLAA